MIAAGMKEVAGCVVRLLRGPFSKFKIISYKTLMMLYAFKDLAIVRSYIS